MLWTRPGVVDAVSAEHGTQAQQIRCSGSMRLNIVCQLEMIEATQTRSASLPPVCGGVTGGCTLVA